MSLSKLHNTLWWEPNNSSITKKEFAFSLSVFKRLMILHYLIRTEVTKENHTSLSEAGHGTPAHRLPGASLPIQGPHSRQRACPLLSPSPVLKNGHPPCR